MPPSASRPRAWRKRSGREAQGQARAFRRHRRCRDERHRGSAAHTGLWHQRLGSGIERRDAPADRARRTHHDRPCRGQCRRRGRGCRVERRTDRQPGADRCARAGDSGGATRADARRADALEAGDRCRRHPRQDDDDEPDRERARRGWARSDLRHRRPPAVRGHTREARHRRVSGGGGRRVRRVVPRSSTGARGDHQHRRRSHGNIRPRLRPAQGGVRAFRSAPAVLRRGRNVRRRCQRARDRARDHQADRHLRPRGRCAGTCGSDSARSGPDAVRRAKR